MSKYKNQTLTPEERNMPLVILNRDNDGHTALDLAIEMERPKCFELMTNMLTSFSKVMLSRSMIKSFPFMISQNSPIIHQFFEKAMYQPKLMKEPLLVNWPQGK